MNANPSFFVSDARPVEGVTWPDVQQFLMLLHERVPELDARRNGRVSALARATSGSVGVSVGAGEPRKASPIHAHR